MPYECIASLKDIVVGIAAASAAYFAYQGLNTWQRELKGKSEYDLAKSVLHAVYKVREGIKHVRSPAIFGYEYPPEMTTNTGHLAKEHRHAGTSHVYQERWKKVDEAFKELEELYIEALVEWGSEYQDMIIDLRKCRGELMMAIQHLLSQYEEPHEPDWMDADERRRQQAVIYSSGEENERDTFTPEINAAIKKFDDWLRPHIAREK